MVSAELNCSTGSIEKHDNNCITLWFNIPLSLKKYKAHGK
jgi:hypothetical protein